MLITIGFVAIYIIPAIILAIFHQGAPEYVIALTLFLAAGMIFWPEDAVLRG